MTEWILSAMDYLGGIQYRLGVDTAALESLLSLLLDISCKGKHSLVYKVGRLFDVWSDSSHCWLHCFHDLSNDALRYAKCLACNVGNLRSGRLNLKESR